jgi:chemotaxis protein MotB
MPPLPQAPLGSEGGGERWLITYSDLITLLMVMFIILYSTANTDLEKFKALAESMAQGFGATSSAGATSGESSGTEHGDSAVFDTSGGGEKPLQLFPENQTPIAIFEFAKMLEGAGEAAGKGGGLKQKLEQLVQEAAQAAAGELKGMGAKVEVTYNERGIMITIFPDQILFDSGSAHLKPGFKAILNELAPQLARLPNAIEVDGHTDNIPISTAAFPSNWELSAARGGAVIRYLESIGLPAARLSAAGYADTRPVDSNATREGRARNRRVELLVLRGTGESLPPAMPERSAAPEGAPAPAGHAVPEAPAPETRPAPEAAPGDTEAETGAAEH